MERPVRIAIPTVKGIAEKYVAALTLLGAEPVLLHEATAEGFDGLLVPGSAADVDPSRYGQEPVGNKNTNPALDAHQLAVVDAFVRAEKPIFGICRGHQLLNVYFGGSLVQDLPRAAHHIFGEVYLAHGAAATEGSFLAPLYGARFSINSSHHQAVDKSGKGLRVALTADDGTVEAQQHESLPVWSVQWHPELMCGAYSRSDTVDGAVVLRWFIEQCRERRT
ncbi:MAG: gamma-glutamyl-gamma-aminobutyrate hydrolase family protein [Oscillospiraceae bacterium]|nr:gamma-glutamyl-gamma-aminobutyrate hydrolase family protein [Oscillospiraceae bacterium]